MSAEVLPDDVLGPARDQFFVAEIEGVLEVKQRRHQPDRQTGPAGGTHASTDNLQRRPKQVIAWYHLA
jgi:hypothetical protein